MGCASSTQVTTDPVTGQKTSKNRMGGAYPGNRRTPLPMGAAPNAGGANHFVAHGGGNALQLKPLDAYEAEHAGAQLVSVTIPAGVSSGQAIHVQAPDGRLNEIVVPPGMGPGSTFTVEFAPEEKTSNNYDTSAQSHNNAPYVSSTANAAPSSYNNNYVSTQGADGEVDLSAYPSATENAKPVYNASAY